MYTHLPEIQALAEFTLYLNEIQALSLKPVW